MNSVLNGIKGVFLNLDLFASGINFHISGKSRNTNFFGVIFTLITILITLLSSYNIINNFIKEKNATIRENIINSNREDKININGHNFFFILNDLSIQENGILKPISRNFFTSQFAVLRTSNFRNITASNEAISQDCSEQYINDEYIRLNNFNEIEKSNFLNFTSNSSICFPKIIEKTGINISHFNDESYNFRIIMHKDDIVNKTLVLDMYYKDYVIDADNSDNPIRTEWRMQHFFLNKGMNIYDVTLRESVFEIYDPSFIYEIKRESQIVPQLLDTKLLANIQENVQNPSGFIPIAQIRFMNTYNKKITEIRYTTFDEVIAVLGGSFSVFFFIMSIIYSFLVEKLSESDLVNSIFSIYSTKSKSQNIEKLKELASKLNCNNVIEKVNKSNLSFDDYSSEVEIVSSNNEISSTNRKLINKNGSNSQSLDKKKNTNELVNSIKNVILNGLFTKTAKKNLNELISEPKGSGMNNMNDKDDEENQNVNDKNENVKNQSNNDIELSINNDINNEKYNKYEHNDIVFNDGDSNKNLKNDINDAEYINDKNDNVNNDDNINDENVINRFEENENKQQNPHNLYENLINENNNEDNNNTENKKELNENNEQYNVKLTENQNNDDNIYNDGEENEFNKINDQNNNEQNKISLNEDDNYDKYYMKTDHSNNKNNQKLYNSSLRNNEICCKDREESTNLNEANNEKLYENIKSIDSHNNMKKSNFLVLSENNPNNALKTIQNKKLLKNENIEMDDMSKKRVGKLVLENHYWKNKNDTIKVKEKIINKANVVMNIDIIDTKNNDEIGKRPISTNNKILMTTKDKFFKLINPVCTIKETEKIDNGKSDNNDLNEEINEDNVYENSLISKNNKMSISKSKDKSKDKVSNTIEEKQKNELFVIKENNINNNKVNIDNLFEFLEEVKKNVIIKSFSYIDAIKLHCFCCSKSQNKNKNVLYKNMLQVIESKTDIKSYFNLSYEVAMIKRLLISLKLDISSELMNNFNEFDVTNIHTNNKLADSISKFLQLRNYSLDSKYSSKRLIDDFECNEFITREVLDSDIFNLIGGINSNDIIGKNNTYNLLDKYVSSLV